jgi:hypothetical protein
MNPKLGRYGTARKTSRLADNNFLEKGFARLFDMTKNHPSALICCMCPIELPDGFETTPAVLSKRDLLELDLDFFVFLPVVHLLELNVAK